jgi:iron complex outermembrane receptor protein
MNRSSVFTLRLACGISALAIAQLWVGSANAQNAAHATPATTVPPVAEDDGSLSEVVVTARQSKENLIQTPVAVVALTSAQLDLRGVTSIQNLQDFTPGFRHVNQTFGRNDRGYQTYVMRGIYGGDGAPRQPVRIFVDGTPLISGDIAGLDAVERVEVVEGPQAAYFGRSTFAGAVNFIMKTPSDTPKVTGSAQISSFDSKEFRASIEGPLLGDRLTARLSGLYDDEGGQYQNAGLNSRLGAQKTKSVSLSVHAEPFNGVRIKAFEQYWTNDDGLPAQGLLGKSQYNCNAGSAPAGTLNYTCGAVGSVPASTLYYNVGQFSPQTVAGVTSGDVVYFLPNNFITSGGLKRKASQGFLAAEVDLPGSFLLNANVSYLDDKWSNLIDGYQQPTSLTRLISTPQHLQGKSTEVRISSPTLFDHLKFVVGGNYLYQNILAAAPGTLGQSVVFYSNPALYVGKTTGLFASAHYGFNDKLSLDLEGRYQWDNVRQAIIARPQSLPGTVPVDVSAVFKSFTPKAVLSYKFTPAAMLYASYSKGTRPGEFNVSTFALPAATRDALVAQSNLQLKLGPEKLDMYEVGFKGEFFNHRVRLLTSAYYGDWQKRHVTGQISIPGTTTFVTPITDQGSVELYGVEATLNARATNELSFEGTFAYNESRIKSTFCTACLQLTGNGTPTGTRLPAYPALTGSFGATYSRQITDDVDGFIRGDFIYTGRQYDSESNLAWTPSSNRVNVRVGIQRGNYAIELFGRNIFDSKVPSSIFRSVNVLDGGSALAVSPPERATVGIKFSVK